MTCRCSTGSAERSLVGCLSRHLRRTFLFLRSKRRKRKSRRSGLPSCHLLELTNHESCAKKTVATAGTCFVYVAHFPELCRAACPIRRRLLGTAKPAVHYSGDRAFARHP